MYYRILANSKENSKWSLKSPQGRNGSKIEPWAFITGQKYSGTDNLHVSLRREGSPVDFNFCDFDVIVTTQELNRSLKKEVGNNNIQCIPVEVESNKKIAYEILNVLDVIECIDENRSEFLKWSKEDRRPDKEGQYRMVTKLRIDPKKAIGHKLFRIKNWEIAVIVDEDIKKLLEAKKISGIVFQSVM